MFVKKLWAVLTLDKEGHQNNTIYEWEVCY